MWNQYVQRKRYRATEDYRTVVSTRGLTVARRLNSGLLTMQLSDIGTRFSPDMFLDLHDPEYLTHFDPTEYKRRKHSGD